MVVNNMGLKPLLLTLFLVVVSGCSTSVKPVAFEQNGIVSYVFQNILQAFIDLGDRIEYCAQLETSNPSPKLDQKKLNALNAVREDAVLALTVFGFRNTSLCQQEARAKLSFYLGTMESLKKELGIIEDITIEEMTIEQMWLLIPFPPKRELELEVNYSGLSQETRDYFQDAIGNKPFDLVDALEFNGLMRKK